jgi:phospholipase C
VGPPFDRGRVVVRVHCGFRSAASGSRCSDGNPIKHLIVIIGENRSFDHIFGAYKPQPGQSVFNMLSQGIIKEDGTPGRNFSKAAQYQAQVSSTYESAPSHKEPYLTLPPAMTGTAPQAASDQTGRPFRSAAAAATDEGILPSDQHLLLTGATGLPQNSIDTRIPNATALPNGPYQLTPGVPYDSYSADPVHRFFQMRQQLDCAVRHAKYDNPSGCLGDLFAWVEVTVSRGGDGKSRPQEFNDRSTGEGSAAMGFYNVNNGDAPYFKELADTFTMSDNYHQPFMGGTGANHIMLGTGDAIWYSDGEGKPGVPPQNQIENPNPQAGTNNYYVQDGYAGGSYVGCADASQPGVAPILDYLGSLPYKPDPNCEPGHYYLVNNYAPGYRGDGSLDTRPFVVPPVKNLRTIGDALLQKNISFRYYGEGWDAYVKNPSSTLYCTICNFLQYTPPIMTNASLRSEHIGDLPDFYSDVRRSALPAVSFVKPSRLNWGHPLTSKINIFEAFLRRMVDEVRNQPSLWADTAIFITFDEGGGYYDSGYVQPIDFFGDGTRVPLLVVSRFATGGRVAHTYSDHVSILKFIEKNWAVPPLSPRSRDNLPNPAMAERNAYVPTNGPAIGDLMDMFKFYSRSSPFDLCTCSATGRRPLTAFGDNGRTCSR